MSALAEALVAAQRRALTALQSAFVAGRMTRDEAISAMNLMGVADAVEQDRLIYALAVIRDLGAPMPSEPPAANGEPAEKKPEPASAAQIAYITKLVKDKQVSAPDLPLSKAQAHEIIDALQDGSYDATKWSVPF